MKTINKFSVAILAVSISLVGCGGDSDSDNGAYTSTKSYPWSIIAFNKDANGTDVLQRMDRQIVDNVLYQKPPVRLGGGQATINYYDSFYFNKDFFFAHPGSNTKYGVPDLIIDSYTDSRVVGSPYNTEKNKFVTFDLNYKVIDLSGKSVVTANDNVLVGQNSLRREYFPKGAKCRAVNTINVKLNVGNKDTFFSFDNSDHSKTSYNNFNDWQNNLTKSMNIIVTKVENGFTGDAKNIPIRILSATDGNIYVAVLYKNRVHNVDIYRTGNFPGDAPNSCVDYNDVASEYIARVVKDNFKARPNNHPALTNLPDSTSANLIAPAQSRQVSSVAALNTH